MPTTVRQLFEAFQIMEFHHIKWGTPFIENGGGIYMISTIPTPEKHLGILEEPKFDEAQISKWINKFDDFKIDDSPASPTLLKARLCEFWLKDESILYVGKASKRWHPQS